MEKLYGYLFSPMPTEQLSVPKAKHSIIIGQSGATVKTLRSKCGKGFSITIPERDDASDAVTLEGTPKQIETAKNFIQELLSDSPGAASGSSGEVTGEIKIPKQQHCAIIGAGGKTIQTIKQKSGVSDIIIPKDDSDIVIIHGSTKKQVEAAKKLITKYVNAHEAKTEETDVLFKKHGKRTQKHADARARLFDEAKVAYDSGDKAKAAKLREKAKLEHQKMLASRHSAALSVFKKKNKSTLAKGEIDLHGLIAEEAVGIVDVYIHKFQKKGKSELVVIYGKGLHSEGDAVVKPQVRKFLTDNSFAFEEIDGGSVRVTL